MCTTSTSCSAGCCWPAWAALLLSGTWLSSSPSSSLMTVMTRWSSAGSVLLLLRCLAMPTAVVVVVVAAAADEPCSDYCRGIYVVQTSKRISTLNSDLYPSIDKAHVCCQSYCSDQLLPLCSTTAIHALSLSSRTTNTSQKRSCMQHIKTPTAGA